MAKCWLDSIVDRPKPLSEVPAWNDLLRIKSAIMKSLREWMDAHGFMEIFLPGMTDVTGSCETVANIWFVMGEPEDFLPLRQTAQLAMEEELVRSNLPRLYTCGRSYRRERRDERHLADFELFEWEALDISLEKLIEYNADLIEYVIASVLRTNYLDRERQRVLYYWLEKFKATRPVLAYRDALAFLRERDFGVEYGADLHKEHEQALTEYFGIVQVTHYPERIKFFNMLRSRSPRHIGSVDCVDLLLPYAGEAIGGSAREHDYDILREKLVDSLMLMHLKEEYLKQGGNDPERIVQVFQPYLDLFKDRGNPCPRAGAGLGLARLLQFIISLAHIIPF